MRTLLDVLNDIFKNDQNYLDSEGNVLKEKIKTSALKMDEHMLSVLFDNDDCRKVFFKEMNGKYIFDKTSFLWVLTNNEFLSDSFTLFSKKIGLVNENRDFLMQTNNVVLSFPYKDCVLEFDSTDEDEERKEVFLNEVLASSKIDTLFSTKCLCDAKKYSLESEGTIVDSYNEENLLIKGNNLIAMHSLLPRFEGKIKCMYWDILYNTKSDHVPYNDSFKHSSWLTMMKNRLEVGQLLLDKDGVIMLQCDDNEMAYLKVLCDEIFGRDAYISTFNLQVRYADKSLNEKSDFQPVNEYVLIYKKNKDGVLKPNKPYEEYSLDSFCFEIVEKTSGTDLGILGGKHVTLFKDGEYEIIKHPKGRIGLLKSTWASGSVLKGNTSGKYFDKVISERKDVDGLKCLYKVDGIGEDGLGYRYFTGPKKATTTKGLFYAGVPLDRKEEIESGKASKKYFPITNIYDFSPDFGNCRHEGGVELVGGKKPEVMIQMLLGIFTNKGDLVLDAYSGTGTTAAVCMKMERRFIAIEQLDSHFKKSKTRLLNVINGDKTGISEDVNWLGGGEFISFELASDNKDYLNKILSSDSKEKLISYLKELIDDARVLNYEINIEELKRLNANSFDNMDLDEMKKCLVALLDKNIIYTNYSEISSTNLTKEEKAFSQSFYSVKE